jgi:hypothetical protein
VSEVSKTAIIAFWALAASAVIAFAVFDLSAASAGDPPLPSQPWRAAEWQEIQSPSWVAGMARTRVPGGWLVVTRYETASACFVPDPDGAWLRLTVEAPR